MRRSSNNARPARFITASSPIPSRRRRDSPRRCASSRPTGLWRIVSSPGPFAAGTEKITGQGACTLIGAGGHRAGHFWFGAYQFWSDPLCLKQLHDERTYRQMAIWRGSSASSSPKAFCWRAANWLRIACSPTIAGSRKVEAPRPGRSAAERLEVRDFYEHVAPERITSTSTTCGIPSTSGSTGVFRFEEHSRERRWAMVRSLLRPAQAYGSSRIDPENQDDSPRKKAHKKLWTADRIVEHYEYEIRGRRPAAPHSRSRLNELEPLGTRPGKQTTMPTTQKDYYATLGVKKTATADEIRKAFRKLRP